MATSGVTTWSLTARDIITEALAENAIIGIGETPTGPEANICITRLNALLQKWREMQHYQAEGTVAVPANDPSGTIASDVDEIIAARFVESSTNERWLQRFERDEYLKIPNKTASGKPSIFYVEDAADTQVLYVWPVPTVASEVKIDYRRKPEVVTDLSQTVDFPQKYQEALFANLAVRCAGLFGLQAPQELVARAAMLERQMEDEERPSSYFMEPFE